MTIASTLFKEGVNSVRDTMIHECNHACLEVTGQNTKHNSKDWYAAVHRLSQLVLGRDVNVR